MLHGFAQHQPTQVKQTMALFLFLCLLLGLNRDEKTIWTLKSIVAKRRHTLNLPLLICCPFKMCQNILKTHYLFVAVMLQTQIDIANLYLCYLRFTFASRKVTGSKLNSVGIMFLKLCVHCHLEANHINITYSSWLLLLPTREHHSHFLQMNLWFIWYFSTCTVQLFFFLLQLPCFLFQQWQNHMWATWVRCLAQGYILIPIYPPFTVLYLFIWIQLNMLYYIYILICLCVLYPI